MDTMDDEVLPAISNGGVEIPELLNWMEEAASRLVLHVEWAVRVKQCQRIVVLFTDRDTLRYCNTMPHTFKRRG